jgi:hypothetical protein
MRRAPPRLPRGRMDERLSGPDSFWFMAAVWSSPAESTEMAQTGKGRTFGERQGSGPANHRDPYDTRRWPSLGWPPNAVSLPL